MFATAPATARPARSSRGREMMRTTRPPVVDGLSLALQAASSDTSTSTTARIQASYAIVTDFFNGLLGEKSNAKADDCPKQHVFDARMLPAPHQRVYAGNGVSRDDENACGNHRGQPRGH